MKFKVGDVVVLRKDKTNHYFYDYQATIIAVHPDTDEVTFQMGERFAKDYPQYNSDGPYTEQTESNRLVLRYRPKEIT